TLESGLDVVQIEPDEVTNLDEWDSPSILESIDELSRGVKFRGELVASDHPHGGGVRFSGTALTAFLYYFLHMRRTLSFIAHLEPVSGDLEIV
ncbi:MAG: hypothetical protein WBL39_17415, partial [Terrimicrobiaceae bacterium]